MTDVSSRLMSDAIMSSCKDLELFGPDGICPVRLEAENGAPKVLLITGDNASGKSLFAKFLSMEVRALDNKVEVMPLGMRLRTEQGFQRAFVYGDESDSSTGQLSMRAALSGLKNASGSGGQRMLVLDEPDIGLSESFAAALGERIARFCADVPDDCDGIVVVTHSRSIAGAIMETGPWMVRVGSDLRSTQQWLDEGPLPVPADGIEELFDMALERFRAVSKIMRERREAKAAPKWR